MNHHLTQIPGVGKKMAQHLRSIGYPDIPSLRGQDPMDLYERHRALAGGPVDPCVLYVYRLAVWYADHEGILPLGKEQWWNWKD